MNMIILGDIIIKKEVMTNCRNLFYKLKILPEDYVDYKVNKVVSLIDKKKQADIAIKNLYFYFKTTFLISPVRLIYDYAADVGKCEKISKKLPLYVNKRNRFFFIKKDLSMSHTIVYYENIELDDDSRDIRSNIEEYSYKEYQNKTDDYSEIFDSVRGAITSSIYSQASKDYLLNIVNNWNIVEEDFDNIKEEKYKNYSEFNLLDYIQYQYCNKSTSLNFEEYSEVLNLLKDIARMR